MPQTPDDFLNLLQPHYRSALQYCRALSREPNDAQDLLQQALIQALEKLPDLRDPARFKAWFFQIITRTFYRQCRQKFWQRFLPLDAINGRALPDLDQPTFPAIFQEAEEPANERRRRLLAALAQLRPKERAALLLFELSRFSIADIAEIQEEKSVSAVKSRLSRTRLKVKESILAAEKNNEKIAQNSKDITHEIEKMAALFAGRR